MTASTGHEVTFEAGWASLGAWGGIRAVGETRFLIELSNTENITIESTADARLVGGAWWLDEEGGRLLIIERNGWEIERVDLRTGEVVHLYTMQRHDDEAFRSLTIHELSSKGVALLSECELICMDAAGDITWHISHKDFTLGVSSIREDEIVLGSQAPARENHTRRFALSSGDEIT
ncbi:hypothetical protein [Nonomuraea insulae]|uniref:Uncharacterized protein n=1 Tax=Nonomuraea insulae TaxID=1616787 RepID=A0ABW1D5C4_9ACTN